MIMGQPGVGGDYEALITLIYFLHEALGGALSVLADRTWFM